MSTPINSLRTMSVQARAALVRAGYESLEQAAAADEALLAIPGFGHSSLLRLRAWQQDPEAAAKPAPAPLSARVEKLAEELRHFEAQAELAGVVYEPAGKGRGRRKVGRGER